MNKQQQRAWIKAFIQLWEAGEPSSDNNFEDTGAIQDALSETFAVFCNKYNLPPMSADELLVEDIWNEVN